MIPISKVKYALYGALISTSIVSTIAYAGTIDGVFGDYFRNIVTNAASCGTNTAIIGFDTTTGSTFGTQKCTTFQSIVQSVLGTSTAPLGQAMIGYNPDGSPKYGTIDKICIGTGGVYNMCDGVNALGGQIEGSFNTAYGAYALGSKIVGSSNLAIGAQAGNNLISGDNNIAIGYATNFLSPAGSNQLNIGNWIFGQNGNIGIGIQSPTAKLDIAGDMKAANIYSNGKLVAITPPDCFGAGKALQYKSTTGWICENANTPNIPTLSLSQTCNGTPCTNPKPGDTWGANWTTTNTTELSYICNGPTGYPKNGIKQLMPLQMSNNFQTYDQLVASGWVAGAYTCTWTMVGPKGTQTQKNDIVIAGNTTSSPLSLTCTSPSYPMGSKIDCTIAGGSQSISNTLCSVQATNSNMNLAQDLCTSQGWKLVGSTLRYNDLPMNVGLISGTDGSFTTTAKNGSEQKSMTVSYKGTNTTDPYDCANPNSNYLCVTFQNTDGTDWRSLKIAGNNSINLACGEMKGSNLPSSSAAVSAEYTSRGSYIMIKKGSSWSCAEQTKDAGNVLLWAADSMVCPTGYTLDNSYQTTIADVSLSPRLTTIPGANWSSTTWRTNSTSSKVNMYCSPKANVVAPAYTYTENRTNATGTGQYIKWSTTGVKSIDGWTCIGRNRGDTHSDYTGFPLSGSWLSKWTDLYNGAIRWEGGIYDCDYGFTLTDGSPKIHPQVIDVIYPPYSYTEQRSNGTEPGQSISWQTTGVASINSYACTGRNRGDKHSDYTGFPLSGSWLSKWTDLYNGAIRWEGGIYDCDYGFTLTDGRTIVHKQVIDVIYPTPTISKVRTGFPISPGGVGSIQWSTDGNGIGYKNCNLGPDKGKVIPLPLNGGGSNTYEELQTYNWFPGTYACTWYATNAYGKNNEVAETFIIN